MAWGRASVQQGCWESRMVSGAPSERLRITRGGGSVCVWTAGRTTLERSESVSKTGWRRGDDGVLHPAVLSFKFWLLGQSGERAERGRNGGRCRWDVHWRWGQRVENRVIGSADALLRFRVDAGGFLGGGGQQPLQVMIVLVDLRKVVILRGVGGPSISCWHRDIERDRELGWFLRGKPGRVGGVCGKSTRRGGLGGRFILYEIKRRGWSQARFRWYLYLTDDWWAWALVRRGALHLCVCLQARWFSVCRALVTLPRVKEGWRRQIRKVHDLLLSWQGKSIKSRRLIGWRPVHRVKLWPWLYGLVLHSSLFDETLIWITVWPDLNNVFVSFQR